VTTFCGTFTQLNFPGGTFNIAIAASGKAAGILASGNETCLLTGQLNGAVLTVTRREGETCEFRQTPLTVQNGTVSGTGGDLTLTASTSACQ